MEHIFGKRNFEMNSKSALSVLAGWVIGLIELATSKEAIAAVILAFITGAAAWLGQTLMKAIWAVCKHLITRIKKQRGTTIKANTKE
jgi:uncharacterized membrane protein